MEVVAAGLTEQPIVATVTGDVVVALVAEEVVAGVATVERVVAPAALKLRTRGAGVELIVAVQSVTEGRAALEVEVGEVNPVVAVATEHFDALVGLEALAADLDIVVAAACVDLEVVDAGKLPGLALSHDHRTLRRRAGRGVHRDDDCVGIVVAVDDELVADHGRGNREHLPALQQLHEFTILLLRTHTRSPSGSQNL